MKLSLGSLILVIGLIANSSPATAVVPVSCAPGLAPVQSEGIQIDNGVIQILDNACAPTPGGTLPDPLVVTNVAAVPASINAGEMVTYVATVSDFIVLPEPGVTYDSCSINVVRPGGQVDFTVAVPSLSASINIPITIPSQGVAGTWQLAMKCRRFVGGQEIILPVIPVANVQVASNQQPSACDNLQAPFSNGGTATYQSHAGVTFGTDHGWAWNFTGNNFNNNQLQSVRVRSYSFVAPAGQGKINFPSSVGGIAASISSQCGNYTVPVACLGVASSAITWSTGAPSPSKCALVPGQTYFLNFAWFNIANFISNGAVNSTCGCEGPQCSSSCQFGNNATP